VFQITMKHMKILKEKNKNGEPLMNTNKHEFILKEKSTISIIGPGVVGKALARLASQVGYRIAAVAGGSQARSALALARAVGASAMEPAEAAAAGELVLLTVRDEAIGPLCGQLARAGALAHKPIVAHCCGAMGSEVLAPARQLGCAVGSMHPMQTFPDADAAIATLPGAYFFIEGTGLAATALEQLARDIGCQTGRINSADKPLYHAAAVMGANYLTTMLDAAFELFTQAGLGRDQARQAIAPLATAAVENTLNKDAPAALTGPIARGDLETLAKHLEAMQRAGTSEETKKLYRQAGVRTVQIAKTKGTLSQANAQALIKLLRSE